MIPYIPRKLCLLSVIVLCSFLCSSSFDNAGAEVRVLVDNYDDSYQATNSLNYRIDGNMGEAVCLYSYNEYHETNWTGYKETNNALELTYECFFGDILWYVSEVCNSTNFLDISDFKYLSFRIKGERGKEDFYIQLRYGNPIDGGPKPFIEIHSADYFTVTNEWQQVNIPLSEFIGLDKTKMRAIRIEFRPDLNTPDGRLYLDTLGFSKGYGKPKSTGPVRIDKETKTLLVNGRPFTIKGVAYQPTPIDSNVYPPAHDSDEYKRDFPLLVKMGCNTIRTWGDPASELMSKAEKYRLKVIAGFWMDDKLDYQNPSIRNSVKQNFKIFVNKYKKSPALLMWGIGNECNYSHIIKHSYYYSLCNELAEIAYQLEGAGYHPVMIVNGKLYHIGMADYNADDMRLNYLDVWGANLYAKDYYAVDWFTEPDMNIFEVYKAKSSKPLVITEYGADAYHTISTSSEITGKVEENEQGEWVRKNTLDIMAASDVCLGGCVMAYSDEWWKDPAGAPDKHDEGPAFSWYSHLPDGYANEEYWGIVSISKNKRKGQPDIVKPRKVYQELKKIFTKQN